MWLSVWSADSGTNLWETFITFLPTMKLCFPRNLSETNLNEIHWCCCWKCWEFWTICWYPILQGFWIFAGRNCRYCWHIVGKAGDVPGDRVFANIADMLTDSQSVPKICPQKANFLILVSPGLRIRIVYLNILRFSDNIEIWILIEEVN